MKGIKLISLVLLIMGFSSVAFAQSTSSDKSLIKEVINQETRYFANGDFEKWKTTWMHSPKALHTGASSIGFHKRQGWNTIKSSLKKIIEDTTQNIRPDDLILKRRNFHFIIEDSLAWVNFISSDNINENQEITDKMESRVLKKEDGKWKILYVNTIDISTYEE